MSASIVCADILVNGGLEIYDSGVNFKSVASGSRYADWESAGGGDIEFVREDPTGPAHEGKCFVDLNGVNYEGAISQTLNTNDGQKYIITFAMSGNPGVYSERLADKTMDILWNGEVAGSFVFEHVQEDTQQNLRWEIHSVEVIADGNDVLTLASTTHTYNDAGPMIDGVTVEPIIIPFQIIASETPMVSGGGQGIRRYLVKDTFGITTQLTPITGELVDDPAGLALRNRKELFVGNRSAHSGGSIRRFLLEGSVYTPDYTITGNGAGDCHQLVFDPNNGELFQTNRASGQCARFLFDNDGNSIPNGTIAMPDGDYQLGVAVRPTDRQLFVSAYQYVRRFGRNGDGSYTYIDSFAEGSNEGYHFMKFRDDELYLAAFTTNRVLRYSFDASGNPVYKDAVASEGAVDLAFSPDEQEMFVTNHRNGGISRFRYDPDTDSWTQFGDIIETPMLAGIVVTEEVCPYRSDMNGDCDVEYEDVNLLAEQWLDTGDADYCVLTGELADQDCHVTMSDLAYFASEWLMN